MKQGEGGQHEVRVRDRTQVLQTVRAIENEHTQPRRELDRLSPPVRDYGCWRDHQTGHATRSTRFFFRKNVRERLQGFSQPHVVGQNPVQPMAREKLHPAKSRKLVVTQGRAQSLGGWHGLDAGKIPQFRREFGKVGRCVDAKIAKPRKGRGVKGMNPCFRRKFRINQRRKMMQNAPHSPDRKLQRIAVRQGRVNVPEIRPIKGLLKKITLQQLGKDRQKVVTLTTDIKADRKAEPSAFHRRKLAVPLRGIGLENPVANIVSHTHPPAQVFQTRNHFTTKLMPKGIHRHTTGIGKPTVTRRLVAGIARLEVDEKSPSRIRLQ